MSSNRSYDIPYFRDYDPAMQMYNWCEEQFGQDNIWVLYRTIYFNCEEDYTWFILRWS